MSKGIYDRTKSKPRKLHTEATKLKMRLALLGKPKSVEHAAKIHARLWKGDEVSYAGLHMWVKKELGAPKYCEHCKKTDKKRYEWANISRQYKRVLTDWVRLCKSCHIAYDKEVIYAVPSMRVVSLKDCIKDEK